MTAMERHADLHDLNIKKCINLACSFQSINTRTKKIKFILNNK